MSVKPNYYAGLFPYMHTPAHTRARAERPMLLYCTLMLPTAKRELFLRLNLHYLKHLHCVGIHKDISLKGCLQSKHL